MSTLRYVFRLKTNSIKFYFSPFRLAQIDFVGDNTLINALVYVSFMCLKEMNRHGALADIGKQGWYWDQLLFAQVYSELSGLLLHVCAFCRTGALSWLIFSLSSAISQSRGGDYIQLLGYRGCCFCLLLHGKSVPVHWHSSGRIWFFFNMFLPIIVNFIACSAFHGNLTAICSVWIDGLEAVCMNHCIHFPYKVDAKSFSDSSFPACYISSDRRLCSRARWALCAGSDHGGRTGRTISIIK